MDEVERMLESSKTQGLDGSAAAFLVQSWVSQLDLIEHLCHYSRHVLLVQAPSGGGKSTLLRLFLEKESPHLDKQVLRLEGNETKERITLNLEQLFPPKFTRKSSRKEEENINDQVLLVDNAELASDEVLVSLLKASTANQSSRGFHLILFAKPSVEHRLIEPSFLPYIQGKVHSIEIDPFSYEESKAFLRRWQFQGGSSHGPLSPEAIQAIYDHSEGWPGRILEQVARKKPLSSSAQYWQVWQEHPVGLGLVVILLLCMIVVSGILLFSPEEGTGSMKQESQALHMGKGLEGEGLVFSEVSPSEPELEVKRIVKSAPKLLPDLAARDTEQFEPDPEPDFDTYLSQTPISTPVVELKAEPELKQVVAPAAPSTAPVRVALQAPSPAAKPAQQKVANLPKKGYYTVQILGASSQVNIKHFVQEHHLKEARTLSLRVRGKPWYVLFYGEFATKSEAEAALKKLPKTVQSLKPWVRHYEG